MPAPLDNVRDKLADRYPPHECDFFDGRPKFIFKTETCLVLA
jgi:hypothetical protein